MLVALGLGAMQGITEFLPISSSAHLILARDVFGWSFGDERANLLFDVVLHVGTMLAVVLFFRKDLLRIFGAMLSRSEERRVDRRLGWYILVGTVPAALAGVLFEEPIEQFFRQRVDVIVSLLAGVGVLMWLADRLGRKRRDIEGVTLWDALLMGVAQASALMPGVSRSGATITTGLALGLKREDAARFSFLLSTPAIVGAALWTLKGVGDMQMVEGAVPLLIAGFLASVVFGMASIGFLLRFLQRRTVLAFTVYRILVALWLYFALVR
ncbi:MAG: undecaprenyl-diphosphatase [Fimbriimonadales bacterium]